MDFGFTSVAAITVICYLAAEFIKLTKLDKKWIPIICGASGGVLGVIAMSVMPAFPEGDYLSAIAVGIVSGLAATGVHQVGRQIFRK